MHPFFDDYLDRLAELHREIEHALEGLPQAGIDWPPGRNMNSIGVLITHLSGAERYWVSDVVAGEPSGRVRESEFAARGRSAAELIELMSNSLDYIRSRLETLSLQDLDAHRVSPRDGRAFTVAWALLHVLEHTALHLGHIQIARQLWHQRQIA